MTKTSLNAAVALTQQSVNTALNGRLHFGSVAPSAPGVAGMTTWRNGVVVTTNQGGSNNIPNDMQIKASGSPSLVLTCEAGHCIISRSGQGPYWGYLPAQGSLTLADASTLNPRIDLIIAQVYDTAIGDSVAGLTPSLSAPGGLVISSVTGTPAASPVAPTQPAETILLAQVAVATNATAITNGNITDKRRSTFNSGGGRTQLPGDVAVTDNGAVSGELRSTVSATGPNVRIWSGTAWQPIAVPVYTSTANRDSDLGATGQYSGQLAVAGQMLTGTFGTTWFNIAPLAGPPDVQVRQSAGQTITTATFTSLAFDLEDTPDAYGMHDPVTNNSRITCTIHPGVYRLAGGHSYVNDTTGQRGTRWLLNGTEIAGSQEMHNATGGTIASLHSAKSLEVVLAINDYVELQTWHSKGSNLLTLATGSAHCTMSVTWVRST